MLSRPNQKYAPLPPDVCEFLDNQDAFVYRDVIRHCLNKIQEKFNEKNVEVTGMRVLDGHAHVGECFTGLVNYLKRPGTVDAALLTTYDQSAGRNGHKQSR